MESFELSFLITKSAFVAGSSSALCTASFSGFVSDLVFFIFGYFKELRLSLASDACFPVK